MKVHIARNIMIKWQGSRLYTVNARKKTRNGESNIMQQMRGSVV